MVGVSSVIQIIVVIAVVVLAIFGIQNQTASGNSAFDNIKKWTDGEVEKRTGLDFVNIPDVFGLSVEPVIKGSDNTYIFRWEGSDTGSCTLKFAKSDSIAADPDNLDPTQILVNTISEAGENVCGEGFQEYKDSNSNLGGGVYKFRLEAYGETEETKSIIVDSAEIIAKFYDEKMYESNADSVDTNNDKCESQAPNKELYALTAQLDPSGVYETNHKCDTVLCKKNMIRTILKNSVNECEKAFTYNDGEEKNYAIESIKNLGYQEYVPEDQETVYNWYKKPGDTCELGFKKPSEKDANIGWIKQECDFDDIEELHKAFIPLFYIYGACLADNDIKNGNAGLEEIDNANMQEAEELAKGAVGFCGDSTRRYLDLNGWQAIVSEGATEEARPIYQEKLATIGPFINNVGSDLRTLGGNTDLVVSWRKGSLNQNNLKHYEIDFKRYKYARVSTADIKEQSISTVTNDRYVIQDIDLNPGLVEVTIRTINDKGNLVQVASHKTGYFNWDYIDAYDGEIKSSFNHENQNPTTCSANDCGVTNAKRKNIKHLFDSIETSQRSKDLMMNYVNAQVLNQGATICRLFNQGGDIEMLRQDNQESCNSAQEVNIIYAVAMRYLAPIEGWTDEQYDQVYRCEPATSIFEESYWKSSNYYTQYHKNEICTRKEETYNTLVDAGWQCLGDICPTGCLQGYCFY